MIVNEISKQTGVAPHVVRYYARIGLLRPARHPENGYKLFGGNDVRRLRFIRQAKDLGFTLSEIERLLDEISCEHSPCPTVRRLLQQRMVENRREIARLTGLQARMESALALWEEMPDGYPHDNVMCPLIEGASVKQ